MSRRSLILNLAPDVGLGTNFSVPSLFLLKAPVKQPEFFTQAPLLSVLVHGGFSSVHFGLLAARSNAQPFSSCVNCTGSWSLAIGWKVSVTNVTLPDATGMFPSVIPYVPNGEFFVVRSP